MSGGKISPNHYSLGRGGIQGGSISRPGVANRQSPAGASRATFSRASMSRAGSVSVRDPNQVAADVENININSPDAIERERHLA